MTVNSKDQNELAVLARKGNEAAKTMLLEMNEKFVIGVARQYMGQGLEIDDLIQEGNIGMLKAIEKFDPKMGTKFLTYASWWIKQSILQALAEFNRHVRIPANRIGIIEQYRKQQEHLTQELMREPAHDEVLSAINADNDDVVAQVSVSFHTKTTNEGEGILMDLVPSDFPAPDAKLMEEGFQQELAMVLDQLEERERTIIKMSFGIGYERMYTLEEIGEKLKLTRERIRQVKQKAIKQLRRMDLRKKLDGIKD